tara:strand:+ start:471 stop:1073 length:603 start_codon:yes stop_codon:yes gene_type:complete
MSVNIKQFRVETLLSERVDAGIELLSQQIWCWGRDIMRPDGNWLIERGFNLIRPPVDDKKMKNIYSLSLPNGRRIMLRGFGIIYTDNRYGSIYLPRFEFIPKYTSLLEFEELPWSVDHLSEFSAPVGTEMQYCSEMLADVIDWIIMYEQDILAHLGENYRNETLYEWDNGKRRIIAPQEVISEWLALRNDAQKFVEELSI